MSEQGPRPKDEQAQGFNDFAEKLQKALSENEPDKKTSQGSGGEQRNSDTNKTAPIESNPVSATEKKISHKRGPSKAFKWAAITKETGTTKEELNAMSDAEIEAYFNAAISSARMGKQFKGNEPQVSSTETTENKPLTPTERVELTRYIKDQVGNTGVNLIKSFVDLSKDDELIKWAELLRLNGGTAAAQTESTIKTELVRPPVPYSVIDSGSTKSAEQPNIEGEQKIDPLRQQQKPLRAGSIDDIESASSDTTSKPSEQLPRSFEFSIEPTYTSSGHFKIKKSSIKEVPAGWDARPPGPEQIKPKMKELLDVESPEWRPVAALENEIESKSGAKITRGGKTPEESLDTLQTLNTVLDSMPVEAVRDQRFAIGPMVDHKDGTIDVPIGATQKEIQHKLAEALKLPKIETTETKDSVKASTEKSIYTREFLDYLNKLSWSKETLGAAAVAGMVSGGDVKNTLKPIPPVVDKQGQADLPGIHSVNSLKEAKILPSDFGEQASESASTPPIATERGPLLEKLDDELRKSLDGARFKYVAAKRAREEFTSLSRLRDALKLDFNSRQRIDEALERAKVEYDQARAEYVGASIELHLNELANLRAERLEQYVSTNTGLMDNARFAWRKLGNINYYEYRKNDGREIQSKAGAFLAKFGNARTAIGALLVAGGFGTGIALYRGAGSAIASKDLMEQWRDARHSKAMTPEQLDKLTTLEEVQNQIAIYDARAGLGGKSEKDVLADPYYQKLLDIRGRMSQERFENAKYADRERLIKEDFDAQEAAVDQSFKKERRARTATTLAAGAIGGTVGAIAGAGGINKISEYWNGTDSNAVAQSGSIPKINNPETGVSVNPDESGAKISKLNDPEFGKTQPEVQPNASRTELTFHGKGTGATVEVEGQNTYINAGNRGLEGALQDFKRLDPEKYKGMMAWIKEQYPGTQAKDSTLIHRAIKKLALDGGYTVDGPFKDLSRVDFARVNLTPTSNGLYQLSLDKNTLDFISETPDNADVPAIDSVITEPKISEVDTLRAVDAPTEGVESNNIDVGPEQIETEKLDFKELVPDNGQVDSISSIATENLREATNKAYELALSETNQYKKTSDALKHILKDDYSNFVKKEMNVDGRIINHLQKFSLKQFMQEYAHNDEIPARKLKQFRNMADSINQLLSRSTPAEMANFQRGSMREVLIRLAVERNK